MKTKKSHQSSPRVILVAHMGQESSLIIKLKKIKNGQISFKGPVFTEGFRKGQYDTWILTKICEVSIIKQNRT